MNKTTIYFIVGFVIVATVGVIIAATISQSSSNSNFVATTAPAIAASDWTQGNKNAKVSVIEYGDFQCPACAAYAPIFNQLIKTYGDRALFAFRNFPLYQVHPNAGASAQAAEAAGLQGKYWEMHDVLYSKQLQWSVLPFGIGVTQTFDGYASSLGLNVNKFNADMNGQQVNAKIKADVDGANAAQVDHTPTFFVNLKQIQNPTSYEQFAGIIQDALNSAGGSPATSTNQ